MASLNLSLFGSFKARLGTNVPDFRTSKAQALCVYLVMEAPTIHRRESLMELLWPGLPLQSAQVSLRQVIYQLRKTFPGFTEQGNDHHMVEPLVLSERKMIQLNPAYPVSTDVSIFQELLGRSQVHRHSDLVACEQCQEWLSEAVALYQGDFLADFNLYDSNIYEAWSQAKREGLRQKLLDTLDTLTLMQLVRNDYPAAEVTARQQLEHDPYRESATRQLMRILALTGRRSDALEAYLQCERLLAEELGMAPARKTTGLYEQIRGGELSLSPPPPKGMRGYELGEQIGEGAFGSVYRARQKGVEREVAVKIIQPQYANQAPFIRRFEAEAQIVARLEHPHIVPLYDYWREPDGAYLVMRYLRGGSLAGALAERPYDPEAAVNIIEQMALALDSAHRQGIIHRDVKPSNILLDEEGNAYLSDFGIARETNHDLQLTASDELIGSPAYISPEQLLNEEVTPATDVYSLGLVLYELLAGAKPFSTTSIAELIQKQVNEPLPAIQTVRPELPSAVDDVIQQATAKKAGDRFQDTLVLAAAFRKALLWTDDSHSINIPIASMAEKDIVNPYQGLRPFQETDSERFFGREAFVARLLQRLATSSNLSPSQPVEGQGLGGGRFLAVVGPSGSGKSSVVKAGLIPALRAGALPGSEAWFVAEMMPGSHPLEELEAALLHVAVNPPASLLEPLQKDERGLTRVLKRVLPQDRNQENPGQLLLVIDQFEELFTLVEKEADRTHFIDNLLTALAEPNSRLCLVLTLRADFYDRPLQYPGLGEQLRAHTEVILPLTPVELEQAITRPAAAVGVACEPALITAVTTDVNEQPGALPLLQYALTELFERRDGRQLRLATYQELGGVSGALARRADEIYDGLNADGREAARQVFLRLITLGEGMEDTRRRVRLAEVERLSVNGQRSSENLSPATDYPSPITAYGRYRLLTFDRDPVTREATVEVAHEALLREWGRLRGWLDESRADVRLQRLLAGTVAEWLAADKDEGFLIRGSRLDQFEGWAEETTLALTAEEQELLTASLAARQQREAQEEARRRRELETAQELADEQSQRAEEQSRSARRLRWLAAGLALILLLAIGAAWLAADRGQEAQENANLRATSETGALILADQRATAQAEAEIQRLEADDARATAVAEGARADEEREAALAAQEEAQAAEETAVEEREEAQRQAELAQARELAASAAVSLEEDPERSILLALHSLDLVYTPEGEEVLRQGMMASRVRLTIPRPHENLGGVRYSPDGSTLIAAADDGTDSFIMVWDAATGEVLHSIPCNTLCLVEDLHSTVLSPDGQLLAVTDKDYNIIIIDLTASLETGSAQIRYELVGHTNDVYPLLLSFSPDSTRLASTSFDKTFKVWDLETGEMLYSVAEPALQWIFTPPSFSPDGALLTMSALLTSVEIGARIYDAATGELLLALPSDQRIPLFSSDGKRLITYTDDGLIFLWDVEASLAAGIPQELYRFNRLVNRVAGGSVGAFRSNKDGRLLADRGGDAGGFDVDIYQLGEDEASVEVRLAGHLEGVINVDFSPDGRHLVTTGNTDGIRIWDISPTGEREALTVDAHDDIVGYLALNQDATQFATASYDGTAQLRDTNSGEMLQEFIGHTHRVRDVDISPDGSKVVTASGDRTARVWDATSGEELAVLAASAEGYDIGGVSVGVMSARFSPDGRQIVTAGVDGTVRLWDAATYEEIQRVIVNPSEFAPKGVRGVTLAIFSPDGAYLAAATDGGTGDDGLFKVWHIETGDVVLEKVVGPRLFGLDFSPDGRRLAVSSSLIGLGEVWDLNTGEKLLSLPLPQMTIHEIFFSADGSQLITPANDLMIWDADNGDLIKSFKINDLWGFGLTPDGSRLFAGTGDGLVRVFLTDIDELVTLAESRLTRSFTELECQQYLHLETCPAEQKR